MLLTNDDGPGVSGGKVREEALKDNNEVWVPAPESFIHGMIEWRGV